APQLVDVRCRRSYSPLKSLKIAPNGLPDTIWACGAGTVCACAWAHTAVNGSMAARPAIDASRRSMRVMGLPLSNDHGRKGHGTVNVGIGGRRLPLSNRRAVGGKGSAPG